MVLDVSTRLRAYMAHLPRNLQGAVWIALAGLVLTTMTALIKSVGEAIPVVQILFIRQVVMTLAMAPRMIRTPAQVFQTAAPKLHVLRVALSTVAMTAGFTAMVHLPLADAVAISFSRSFFVAIFAIVILHEIVWVHRWIGIVLGFVGVVVICNPVGGSVDHYTLLALVSAGAVAMIMVIVRKLAQSESLATVITYQALGVGVLLAGPALYGWVAPSALQWALLVCIGGLSTLGQSLNFLGFRVGEATALAPVDYLRLIYSLAIGAVFFLEMPTMTTLAGAVLVIGGTFWGLWFERRGHRLA
ncbi:DMT family transporter [Thioclava sp. SK-1]|uniref:DMT family transporter n=1 Tax=Thioclava sp. SK-1 TaxID=1889770 RepID=UPI0008262DE9|nr:DMT family transporter [Thioclava sp. SK-1]